MACTLASFSKKVVAMFYFVGNIFCFSKLQFVLSSVAVICNKFDILKSIADLFRLSIVSD
jgi:hypothetical protein